MMKKQIAILGSTGSIGTQALEVIAENPDLFEAYALTANRNADLLIKQARAFQPEFAVIADETQYNNVKEALADLPIKVCAGASAIADVAEMQTPDIILTAMVGYAGLLPTIRAVRAGKTIALANKETLVVAGEWIQKLAIEHRAPILPVDSEHSAVFQCLAGEKDNEIEKIILTASGGPFRSKTLNELKTVTRREALQHPNWAMGAKITIDSATMMNKGFEVIEAKWLFGLSAEQIDVVIHPQSIIHSMVQFIDGSVKAQMGLPDMKLPIQYAFGYPTRLKNSYPRLDFTQSLTFEQPDTQKFRNLAFAFEAMRKGGNMPCILNAANEVVVEAFLKEKIGFLQMSDIIERAMHSLPFIQNPTYEDYVETDRETREFIINS
ncbi:MAG: 1-deoxy-D-xylulose-5-phosphate reductoisomerase [Prevotellaceae bacterium]|jgi:1-deoxy-D-xylulose-5-phosphate reductoisomerase|nr:1-deoxy-D-xylulose-5-phosphate reductoisomerase [Prevotellaceae bacterium]